jgi:aminoglycoside phosphotransferase (APT) family kinase protein
VGRTGARGQVGPEFEERLGHELATLHNMTAALHGLDQDNYIGSLPQPNAEHTSWVTFFSEQRIGAQMQIARQKGKLPAAREANLRRLQEWLPIFLDDEAIKPSLLHGDLWGGNYMLATNGDPVLIDPATYYGHREVDLAMTELFGGGLPVRRAGGCHRAALYRLNRVQYLWEWGMLRHPFFCGEGRGRRSLNVHRLWWQAVPLPAMIGGNSVVGSWAGGC